MSLEVDSEIISTAGPDVLLSSSTIVSQGGFSYVDVHNIPGCESLNGRAHCKILADKVNEATSSSLSFGCVKTLLTRTTQTKPVSIPSVQQIQPSTPFQLLPPLPHASSLQFPFISLSPCASLSSPVLPSRSRATQKPIDRIQLGDIREPVMNGFPAGRAPRKFSPFIHPNSPYVPWTPEMKRKFLRSNATPSTLSDLSARRCPDARLQTLELEKRTASDSSNSPDAEQKKKSKALERFACLVGKNIKQAAKRIYRLRKPLAAVSVNSLASSDSNTLAIWLQHQRQLFEEATRTSKDMSLDECDQGDDLDPTLKNEVELEPFHVRSCSDSHLVVSTLGAKAECSCTRTLLKLDREMSMPGGWTFD